MNHEYCHDFDTLRKISIIICKSPNSLPNLRFTNRYFNVDLRMSKNKGYNHMKLKRK